MKVAKRARADLLGGRVHRFCSLLTPHGRERSLGFSVDFDQRGSEPPLGPPVPRSCEDVARREIRVARVLGDGADWRTPLRRARLRVASSTETLAQVRAVDPQSGRSIAAVRLRKVGGSWRIDDSNVVPSGH